MRDGAEKERPEFAKKTRGEQYFFVNNRFIKSPYLNHSVNSAFEGLIDSKYNPTYFLNRGGYTPTNAVSIEYFGLYWHFVDLVWVIVFPFFYLY